MEILSQFFVLLDSYLGSAPYFPFLLMGVGLFFTIYLKVPQLRFFSHAWKVLFGKYEKPDAEGDLSPFQALTTALAGTVGTGNISGVALALYLGGPAALFWMWATAFFGMTTKFVEVTISHKYRVKDKNGFIAGGPMYYMERALNMKWLAIFFAIATVITSFGSGNMPQANSIAQGLNDTLGIAPIITGSVLSILLAAVVIGGIKSIVKVTEKIVPGMAFIYLMGAFTVIFTHIDNIIPSFLSIFTHAFSGSAALGGFLGASFAYAFNRGVNRGLFSNEAGLGSSPIAHAAAKTDEPVSEGMVAILEPFIDTIVICTITGLVILSSGVWTKKFDNDFQSFDTEFISGTYSDENDDHRRELFKHLNFTDSSSTVEPMTGSIEVRNGEPVTNNFTILHNRSIAENVVITSNDAPFNGVLTLEEGRMQNIDVEISGKSLVHSVSLTIKAFNTGPLGDYGQYIVSIGLVLFAFSTAVAWSYYGDRAITYLVGVRWVMAYRIVYVLGFFVATIADTSLIWVLAAISLALMTIPNLFGIMMLRKENKETVNNYWSEFDENNEKPIK